MEHSPDEHLLKARPHDQVPIGIYLTSILRHRLLFKTAGPGIFIGIISQKGRGYSVVNKHIMKLNLMLQKLQALLIINIYFSLFYLNALTCNECLKLATSLSISRWFA